VRIFGRLIDERFLAHRQRSTSIAGILGAILAIVLFEYRYWVNHVLSWDLLAVILTVVGIKMAVMTWYYLTD
jgi:hypothetical protein